ncbi:MAG TPA: mandelate racemase/muconate lactonizing enzyme family protein [Gammaproteobacteria bacterium]|nr:mandelate racemase/muconate lactonizing enzyme family protein [Gammaproteobacteria bacterium]
MKVIKTETLHADAGWRTLSFLKITTDEGIVGYSEYNESFGSTGTTHAIENMGPLIEGTDPLEYAVTSSRLYAMTRLARGGVNAQAIAAIENALLDIKGKALNVPVHELLGGKQRDTLPLYWSHCGTFRMGEATAEFIRKPVMTSVKDLIDLGAEVKESGYKALKCNMYFFGVGNYFRGGFGTNLLPREESMNADSDQLEALTAQMTALREGAGDDIDILLDMNFSFKTEGFLKVMRTLKPFDLFWYELDMFNPKVLAYIREHGDVPIASCESLYGIREFGPYFENKSVDVVIIDVPWNGAWQSYKIAAMADAHEVNVAPHNFYGHLASAMSANFCAALPNFRIMEIEVDDVAWKDDLVTHPPEIRNGEYVVSDRPGWGTDVNEEAVLAHPPK